MLFIYTDTLKQLFPLHLYVMFPAVQTFLFWLNKTMTITKSNHISLLQSELLLHYISIPPNWWEKSLTRVKWDQEELFCSAFIFLMNLSLSCGHRYCGDCPESCSDQPGGGVRGWSRCKQTLNQERKRAPVAEKVAEKIKMKSCFSCCLMPGPGNVPCDVCDVREQRAFKSCLVCLWFLVSRMSHFCFPMCFLRSRFIYSVQKTSLFLTRVRPRDFFAAVDHTSMYHLSSLYMPRKQTKSPWTWINQMTVVSQWNIWWYYVRCGFTLTPITIFTPSIHREIQHDTIM